MPRPAPVIDPDRWYSLPEAAALLPSFYTAGPLNVQTLRGWVRAGKLPAEANYHGARMSYLVKGAEVLRLLAERPPGVLVAAPPAPGPESEATRAAMAAVWAEREVSRAEKGRRRQVVARRLREERGKATDA